MDTEERAQEASHGEERVMKEKDTEEKTKARVRDTQEVFMR